MVVLHDTGTRGKCPKCNISCKISYYDIHLDTNLLDNISRVTPRVVKYWSLFQPLDENQENIWKQKKIFVYLYRPRSTTLSCHSRCYQNDT